VAGVTATPRGDPARSDDDASVVLSAGHYDSFVLRVFSREHDGELLHGEVTHVASRRMQRFANWRSATAFIVATLRRRPIVPEPGKRD
jgi:hypothetical protein